MELHFMDVKPGAYVEIYNNKVSNVLIVYEGYEQTKGKPYKDDYILVSIFQPYDIKLGDRPYQKKRKMTEESWLMIGIPDWEDVREVPLKKANRYIIRGTFEGSS